MKKDWIDISLVTIPPLTSEGFTDRIIVREYVAPKKLEVVKEMPQIKSTYVKPDYVEQETVLMTQDDDSDETVLLSDLDEEATVLLSDSDEEATVLLSRRIAYVKRIKNDEVVIVDKNEFIIGKSSTCDYKVEGNPSISRQHAKIICKEGVYYLEDLNSLNHTSINGEIISGLVEIDDQTTFELADEEFSFFISEE